MPETSKRVADRLHRSQTVENAATRFSAAAAAGCAAAFVPVTELAVPPADVEHVFHLVGRHLARYRRQLVAADTGLVEAREKRIVLRQCQDAAAAAVRSELVALRRLLKPFFGARETARFLAFTGATPRAAGALRAAIHTVRERLVDPRWQPPLHTAGVHLDYTALAARLAPAADALDIAMSDLEAQLWREREALDTQRRALATFDRVYSNVARFLEAALELAGCELLARRVRPGVGRRGRPSATDSPRTTSTPSATLKDSLQERLRKARRFFVVRFQFWRKDDSARAMATDAIRKEEIFSASCPQAKGKASQPKRERFRPWKTEGSGAKQRAA